MRFIYLDEAGTAPMEPVRVVAGVIVEADNQLAEIERELKKIYETFVPDALKGRFQFHATEIWSTKILPDGSNWPLQERLDLIKAVISLPRAMNIPIVFAKNMKGTFDPPPKELKMSSSQFEHFMTFVDAIERADHFIRTRLSGKEVGAIVAENVPAMQIHLSKAIDVCRKMSGTKLPKEGLLQDRQQKLMGVHEDKILLLTNIVNTPLFVKKGAAPMLDIADACAFAIRRWVGRYDHAKDLILCMAGEHYGKILFSDPAWTTSPGSNAVIDPDSDDYWAQTDYSSLIGG